MSGIKLKANINKLWGGEKVGGRENPPSHKLRHLVLFDGVQPSVRNAKVRLQTPLRELSSGQWQLMVAPHQLCAETPLETPLETGGSGRLNANMALALRRVRPPKPWAGTAHTRASAVLAAQQSLLMASTNSTRVR